MKWHQIILLLCTLVLMIIISQSSTSLAHKEGLSAKKLSRKDYSFETTRDSGFSKEDLGYSSRYNDDPNSPFGCGRNQAWNMVVPFKKSMSTQYSRVILGTGNFFYSSPDEEGNIGGYFYYFGGLMMDEYSHADRAVVATDQFFVVKFLNRFSCEMIHPVEASECVPVSSSSRNTYTASPTASASASPSAQPACNNEPYMAILGIFHAEEADGVETTLQPWPVPRFAAASVVLNDIFYLVGGTSKDFASLADMWRYDGQWSELYFEYEAMEASPHVKSRSPASNLAHFKLFGASFTKISANQAFFFGGIEASDALPFNGVSDKGYIFNSIDIEWDEVVFDLSNTKCDQPPRSYFHSATAITSRFLFLFGGQDFENSPTNALVQIDVLTNCVTRLCTSNCCRLGPKPAARVGHTAVAPDSSSLIIYGGLESFEFPDQNLFNDAWLYTHDRWRKLQLISPASFAPENVLFGVASFFARKTLFVPSFGIPSFEARDILFQDSFNGPFLNCSINGTFEDPCYSPPPFYTLRFAEVNEGGESTYLFEDLEYPSDCRSDPEPKPTNSPPLTTDEKIAVVGVLVASAAGIFAAFSSQIMSAMMVLSGKRKATFLDREEALMMYMLMSACREGLLEPLQVLLDHDKVRTRLINESDENGNTALCYAAYGGHEEVLSMLAQHGAQLGAPSAEGLTPLHCACESKQIKTAEMLLNLGAPVDARDFFGQTVLMSAVAAGNAMLVALLIEKGNADVNATDSHLTTPLMLAIQYGHEDIALYLIAKGANGTIVDNKQWTALHWAAATNCVKVVAALCSGELHTIVHLDALNSDGLSPIDLANREGHEDVARLISSALQDLQAYYEANVATKGEGDPNRLSSGSTGLGSDILTQFAAHKQLYGKQSLILSPPSDISTLESSSARSSESFRLSSPEIQTLILEQQQQQQQQQHQQTLGVDHALLLKEQQLLLHQLQNSSSDSIDLTANNLNTHIGSIPNYDLSLGIPLADYPSEIHFNSPPTTHSSSFSPQTQDSSSPSFSQSPGSHPKIVVVNSNAIKKEEFQSNTGSSDGNTLSPVSGASFNSSPSFGVSSRSSPQNTISAATGDNLKISPSSSMVSLSTLMTMGGSTTSAQKTCLRCATFNTAQWRKGPDGETSLCNSCGLKFNRMVKKFMTQGMSEADAVKAAAMVPIKKPRKKKLAAGAKARKRGDEGDGGNRDSEERRPGTNKGGANSKGSVARRKQDRIKRVDEDDEDDDDEDDDDDEEEEEGEDDEEVNNRHEMDEEAAMQFELTLNAM